MFGKIVGIDLSAMTIHVLNSNNPAVEHSIDKKCTVKLNGKEASFTELLAGDEVEVSGRPVVAITATRHAIEPLSGTGWMSSAPGNRIVHISDKELIVGSADGIYTTYSIAHDCIVTLNGVTVTISDLEVGDIVNTDSDPVTYITATR